MLNQKMKPIAAAVGTAFVASLATASTAQAGDDLFVANDLPQGYDLLAAGHGEGKCGEGKCGESDEAKGDEGKCGEGKCGETDEAKGDEGKCGEGKCGETDEAKGGEGKCGEGKCGEGKCGGGR